MGGVAGVGIGAAMWLASFPVWAAVGAALGLSYIGKGLVVLDARNWPTAFREWMAESDEKAQEGTQETDADRTQMGQ